MGDHRVTNKNNITNCSHLLEEWNWSKNTLQPYQVSYGSNQKVWWLGKCGHEWSASPNQRRQSNSGCPFCSGRLATPECNLLVKFPEVAKDWNLAKNMRLAISDITPFSNKKVWWICKEGHEWEAVVASRTKAGNNCPMCAGQQPSKDYNLLIRFPKIAKEWNFLKNGELLPTQVTPFSGKRVWWVCSLGHEWLTTIDNRTIRGDGCRSCSLAHTKLEQFVEDKLGIPKYNRNPLTKFNYHPDFQLSENLYLNVDGLYWHSELNKPNNYHFKLRQAFELEGKRILQFYEDEIYNKWSIVESIINAILRGQETILLGHQLVNNHAFIDMSNELIAYCDLRYNTGKLYEELGFSLKETVCGWYWTDFKDRYSILSTIPDHVNSNTWSKIYDAGMSRYSLALLNNKSDVLKTIGEIK